MLANPIIVNIATSRERSDRVVDLLSMRHARKPIIVNGRADPVTAFPAGLLPVGCLMPLMTHQTRPRLRARRSQLVTNGFYLVSGPRKLETVAALLAISRFAAH